MSRSLSATALIAALLVFSACTDEPTSASDAAPADTSATTDSPQASPSDTKAERAAAAALSSDDVAMLDSTGVPVYVPVLPGGWTFEEAWTMREEEPPQLDPFYSLNYRTPDSTCVYLSAWEGPGERFAEPPPNERDVTVTGVPTDGPVRLGWSAAGEGSGRWAGGLVATEAFGPDGHHYLVGTGDAEGCGLASPEEVEAFLLSLRALDPAADV